MRHVLLAAFAALALAACSKGADKPASPTTGEPAATAAAAPASAPTLLISPEDLRTVGTGDASQGPVVTGSIQPERRADLRAEVSAVVLQVLKENGEAVRAGDLLVKLDDTSIRDSLASAEESQRAAGQAFEQAERQVQRLKTLQAQGMTSMQALEDAEVRRNSAQSELAAAKARVVAARQQLQRTLVRAPFDGVVSDRKVSAGDTAQIGKELLKVIDPRSMRFEGTVSADRMHEIRLGQEVKFRVNGYPDAQFAGKVRRVDASANPTTRQVEVLVAFADPASAPRVAGLYAEGRIATGSGNGAGSNNNGNTAQPLMLAEASIVRQGGSAYVWRIKDNKLQKVAVQLRERDARTGEVPVKAGLTEGDRILRNPSSTLVDGQKIEFAGPTTTAAASSAAMR
jgi:membrane fusion protein (multidrug efflux system)